LGYVIPTTAITGLGAIAMGQLAVVIGPALSGSTFTVPLLGELGQDAVPALAGTAIGLVILKSVLAITLHWFATRRFARYEQEIGDRLFHAYINSSWEQRSKRTVAEVTRIADQGIAMSMQNFVLPIARVPSLFFTFVADR